MTEKKDNQNNDIYDVVLELKSLSQLKDGFSVKYTPKGKENVEKLKKHKGCVITAIGNSNQGKSYILSLLSDIAIPKGFHIKTEGLSITFPENLANSDNTNQRFIILDTEGSQNAITITDEQRNDIYKEKEDKKIEKIENAARDRQITENFLQNLALDCANIVIAVVGQLTFQDQKFLNRIKEFCKKKTLYIIHNLMFLEFIDQVEEHMKDIIEASLFFNVRKQYITDLSNSNSANLNTGYYVETIDDTKNLYIVHLIMARDGSEAGNYYNKSTIDFLRKHISAFTQQKFFDVINSFRVFLCLNIFDYFDLPIEIKEKVEEQNSQNANSNSSSNNNEEKNKDNKFNFIKLKDVELDENNMMKVKTDYDLNLKKCLIDEIGLTTYQGLTTTPPFSYYKNKEKFTIQIEICNKLKTLKIKKYSTNGQYKFRIYGETETSNDKIMFSNIEEGNFILTFSVGLDFITIKSNEPEVDFDKTNGIINITYEITDHNLNDGDDVDDLGDL